MWRYFFTGLLFLTFACGDTGEPSVPQQPKLFLRLSAEETGIVFQNTLKLQEDFDVFRYRNYYNGGGVGIGDINNDGLADVYLTSNMGDNKLLLNKGNWKFEDITEKAGVKGSKVWSTGVSFADVNADGWLDIYVSNSGDINGGNRENELFINNHNLTFTDSAAQYGLADKGFSTHAVFFDYDKDSDLDCYVLNNSFRPISTLGYRNLRDKRDPMGGDKLYRNDNGRFMDVSEKAGIYGSVIGFGLGVTVGDVNQDNWPDLYISNDFYERDYLYLNNGNGTFSEQLENAMGHLSMFSMGADLADLNNDGYPEIFSTDMLPEDDYRLKTMSAFETYDVYQLRLANGYYHQFMRNMLQMNNQDGTFTECGQLAGVAATDWSWGALIADFDNDTFKEIFVTNGIYKDVTNQDFVEFLGSSEQIEAAIKGKKIDFKEFVDKMPSVKLSNYMFSRTSPWHYENVSRAWGLDEPGFSNGAAYGDLDNDGDLDLIVNNVNQDVFVYKNQSREWHNNNYLSIAFKGFGNNVFGLGATVQIFIGGNKVAHEHMPIRGFQSSMDYKMTIGLGTHSQIDSMMIRWPDDKVQIMKGVKVNALITADYSLASHIPPVPRPNVTPLLEAVADSPAAHEENDFNDFDRDRLLYHMVSTQGPAFAKADINNDGLDDFYLGGASGNVGALYLQKNDGSFFRLPGSTFQKAVASEETAAAFFDADGDKDQDLYVVTGGSEHLAQSINNADLLYENKGISKGLPFFEKTEGRLPAVYQSGSCVKPVDVDNDGDLDLFVGTRMIPSYYGIPADQFLLRNDGKGYFTDVSAAIAPDFLKAGMVTDAAWFDHDKNGFMDLLLVGEWMAPTLFMNDGKQLAKRDTLHGLEKSEGWWNRLSASDFDHDGDVDFILGNLGLNSRFKPSRTAPISLYVNDFDQNGSLEPVFTFHKDNAEYPIALRQDIIKQMSALKKKFVYYKDYAGKSINDIFEAKLLERATKLSFYQPHTSILVNNGTAGFQLKPLPVQAQVSPVYGIAVSDVNDDKNPDVILGGNLFAVKPEVGRYDGLQGMVLTGDGKGEFAPLTAEASGLRIKGEIRHITTMNTKRGQMLAVIRNNDTVKFYKIK